MSDKPGMMTDLSGNEVPIPQGATQEPITVQPSDDNMMTDLQGNRVPIPHGATQEDLPQESAASRFGSGVVAGTKAMIPSSATETAKSVAANVVTGGLYSGIEGAKGMYEGYKQAREEGQPIYSSIASGIGSIAGLDPEGIRERAAKGDVAGIVGEAVPSIVATVAGGEHERIGRAFQSDARALKTASATREATTATYAQRLAEQETATDQAIRATKKAQQLNEELGKGNPNVTQQHVDDANTAASAAAANARKATQALNDAHEAHSQAGVDVDRLTRKVQRTATKASEKTTKAVAAAKEDFQKAIPTSPKGAGAYTDRDYDVARRYLEQHHENIEQIGSVQGAYDAFDHIQKGMEENVAPYRQKYAKEPIQRNVMMDVRDALRDNPRTDFIQKGMRSLENYNLLDPTVDEAEDIRKQLNSEVRGKLADTGWGIQTALDIDPDFAAKYAALDSLRNGIYDVYEDKGVQGIRELRQDEASIIKLRNAAQRQLTKGNVRLRGSGESGPIRKMIGKSAGMAGTGTGAGIGAATGIPGAPEAGAMGGKYLGEKLGKLIAPGDLTRDALIERSMKVKGGGVPTTEITGTPAAAEQFGPPQPVSPAMNLYTPQREMTPLHTELATHYDENVNDQGYLDLEKRFKEDIADKKANGVPLEPAEKKILGSINMADAVDRLAAQKQMQERLAAGKTEPRATIPEEFDPLLHPPQSKLAEGMDTQSGIVHDLAHVVVGSERGIDFREGIRSHLHPENKSTGSLMSAPINWEPFVDKDGNVDPVKMKSKMADIAATYVAGGVANDLYHDIPYTENHHLGADVRILKSFMKNVGFTEAEASKMIAQAADDAAQVLSRPGMQDILQQHAAVREQGLDSQYHISPDRMQLILQDVKGIEHETTAGEPSGTTEAGDRPGEEPGARAEAKPEEGDTAELRQEKQGPSKGEGGPIREDEPAGKSKDAEPGPGLLKPEEPKLSVPPERTTGSPETDEAIKKGGGIPGGKIFAGEDYEITQFHDPQTGSSLGFRKGEPITPETTRAMLEESRAKFAKGARKDTPAGSKFVEATPEEHRAELDKNPQAATLSDKTADQLRDHKIYKVQTPDGKDTGIQYHITPEGEAGGFVNNGPYKNATPAILKHAAEQGATHATAWDVNGKLPDLYEKNGLKSVRSEPYDAATYGEPTEQLKNAWKAAGWKEGDPYPSVRHMEFPQKPENPKLSVPDSKLDKWLEDESGYHPDLQAVIKQTRSLSENPADIKKGGTFITPDGRIANLPTGMDHPAVIEKATGERTAEDKSALGNKINKDNKPQDSRIRFLDDTGAVRTRFVRAMDGDRLSVSVPKTGITPEQVDMIRQAVGSVGRNGNLLLERSDTSPTVDRSQYKEFATPKDVEPMLRNIGAHPDQVKPENPALSPKGSSVPLMKNPLKIEGTGEGDKINTLDVAKALAQYTKQKIGVLKPGEEPQAQVRRAMKLAEDEAKYQLNQNNSGKAWYTTDIGIHDKALQDMRPELKDPAKMSLFKMAEAVLSSGQKPYGNLKSAIKAWDAYHETGQFPGVNPDTGKSWGPRNERAYSAALDSINRLVKDKGEQGSSDWLLGEHPLSELRQYMTEGQSPVRGRATDTAPGAMILGAKRGPFAQNLHGIESAFTADMWVSRTWNRWMGTIEHDPETGEITTDSPRNGQERKLMTESFGKTADKLGLSTSSLQAVLWYYEQGLYDVHGAKKESWSFADAAERVKREQEEARGKESEFKFGAKATPEEPEDERAQGWLEMMRHGK